MRALHAQRKSGSVINLASIPALTLGLFRWPSPSASVQKVPINSQGGGVGGLHGFMISLSRQANSRTNVTFPQKHDLRAGGRESHGVELHKLQGARYFLVCKLCHKGPFFCILCFCSHLPKGEASYRSEDRNLFFSWQVDWQLGVTDHWSKCKKKKKGENGTLRNLNTAGWNNRCRDVCIISLSCKFYCLLTVEQRSEWHRKKTRYS